MPNETTADAPGRALTPSEQQVDAPGRAQTSDQTQAASNASPEPYDLHTRSDAPIRERVRKPPPENWIVIDQAIFRFAPAGLPIKLRTLQKYCLNGKIRATLAVTDKNTFKYFLDPTSIDEFIAREAEKAPTENGETEPAPVVRAPDVPVRERVRDDLDIFEHPYVKRLEREVDDYREKYDVLQASARADLIKLHETYAVAQSETLAKYLLLDKGKGPTGAAPPQQANGTN